MKPSLLTKLVLTLLLFSSTSIVHAQTLKEVFSNTATPILYLGIDFTHAKLIDIPESTSDIVERQYRGINEVIIDEPKKYDLKGAFHRENVEHDLSFAEKRNETIKADDNLKSNSSADLLAWKEDDVKKVVNDYNFNNKTGVGVLFVVEGMSKSDKTASVWVTFIDLKTKKILFTEREEGKTSMAFGFRNYWASAFKNLIDHIEKRKYNEWKTKFGS